MHVYVCVYMWVCVCVCVCVCEKCINHKEFKKLINVLQCINNKSNVAYRGKCKFYKIK